MAYWAKFGTPQNDICSDSKAMCSTLNGHDYTKTEAMCFKLTSLHDFTNTEAMVDTHTEEFTDYSLGTGEHQAMVLLYSGSVAVTLAMQI